MSKENEKANVQAEEAEVTVEAQEVIYVPEDADVEKVIRRSVYVSMGMVLVPIPAVNFAALTAIHIDMIRRLSKLYGTEFKEGAAKKIIASVLGAASPVPVHALISGALAAIPVVGIPLDIMSKPVMNACFTYAVGRMFVTHFERGGGLIGANIDAMKEDFAAAFQNSREWLGNVIKGKKAAESA